MEGVQNLTDNIEAVLITSLDVNEKKNKLVIGLNSVTTQNKNIILEQLDLNPEVIEFTEEEPALIQGSTDINQPVKQDGIMITALNRHGQTEKSSLGFGAIIIMETMELLCLGTYVI